MEADPGKNTNRFCFLFISCSLPFRALSLFPLSSSSSVKAVDKRDGGGSHNWGKQDEAAIEEWPAEEMETRPDVQEPVTNGEAAAAAQEDK